MGYIVFFLNSYVDVLTLKPQGMIVFEDRALSEATAVKLDWALIYMSG